MTPLSPRDRRAIVIGALVLAPAVGLAYGVRPFVRALVERRLLASQLRDRLDRERALVGQTAGMPAAAAAGRAALEAELPRAIRAAAVATASVRLADYVRAAARAHDVLIVQTSELSADSLADGIEVLRLNVKAESDLAGILRFLRALETGETRVRIKSMSVDRVDASGAGAAAAAPDAREMLSLSAIVEAPLVLTTAPSRSGQ
jgi:hypothetical protein